MVAAAGEHSVVAGTRERERSRDSGNKTKQVASDRGAAAYAGRAWRLLGVLQGNDGRGEGRAEVRGLAQRATELRRHSG